MEATQEPTAEPTPIPTAVPLSWSRLNSLQFIPRDLVTVIVVDPSDQDVWYAGTTTAGIYKTINGGASWEPALEGLDRAKVDSLIIDPDDPDTLYAGLIWGGVYKTMDGGLTWAPVNSGIDVENSWQFTSVVAMSKQDSQHLYYTNAASVYESLDGGLSWNNIFKDMGDFVDNISYPSL